VLAQDILAALGLATDANPLASEAIPTMTEWVDSWGGDAISLPDGVQDTLRAEGVLPPDQSSMSLQQVRSV
jgi:hypothetical protein